MSKMIILNKTDEYLFKSPNIFSLYPQKGKPLTLQKNNVTTVKFPLSLSSPKKNPNFEIVWQLSQDMASKGVILHGYYYDVKSKVLYCYLGSQNELTLNYKVKLLEGKAYQPVLVATVYESDNNIQLV